MMKATTKVTNQNRCSTNEVIMIETVMRNQLKIQ